MRHMGLVLEDMGNEYASKIMKMRQEIFSIVSLSLVQDYFSNILHRRNYAGVLYLKLLQIFCVYFLRDFFSSKTLTFLSLIRIITKGSLLFSFSMLLPTSFRLF